MYVFSSEMRWFNKGPIPDDIHDWFCLNHEYTHTTPREDQYLKLPDCGGVGVKLREGRFEIKVRNGIQETISLSKNVTGLRDSWLKWSSRDLGSDSLVGRTDSWEPQEWLTVRKERWLRWHDECGARPSPGPLLPAGGSGCSFELTGLRIGNDDWWTLGLEAVGHPDDISALLQTTGARVFADNPLPQRLDCNCSFAYPLWLARFVEVKDDHTA